MSSEFDDLMPVFLEEGREHLETLNLALLAVERDSSNVDAVNDAFRAAHSLKGMSATMGFMRIANLTNELEDVLDRVRDDRSLASHDLVSLLLQAADAVATMLGEIEESGEEQLGVEHLCAELGAVLKGPPGAGAEATQQADEAELMARLSATGVPVLTVTITVSDRSLMPAARAYAALLGLEGCATLLGSRPSKHALEEGAYDGRTVTAWVACDVGHDEVRLAAMTPEVESVTVADYDPQAAGQAAAAASDAAAPTAAEGAALRRGRTVRVDASRLDDLMHGVGELLVHRSRVQTIMQGLHNRELSDAIDALDRAARELQSLVMDVRMVSIDSVFRRLPRLVRDLADELGKDVRLSISGQETELDRTVIDVIGDPLVHLVRNALDHGIEAPDERETASKPRTGMLDVSALTEGGSVLIRVRDDGGGMRPDLIRNAAVTRGVVTREAATSMSDEDALQLCFAAGFSTRSEASSISGRGVGLDVVRASVRALGGDVLVESSDEGTIMTIKLPLTLAIRSVLMVRVGGDVYAFHTDRIGLTVDLDQHTVQSVAGRRTLVHLGEVVPLVDLSALLLGASADESVARTAVILDAGNAGGVGVIVDGVIGQAEVVTRALPAAVRASRLLAASAVLGDGQVAFLVNTEAILSEIERGGAFSVVA